MIFEKHANPTKVTVANLDHFERYMFALAQNMSPLDSLLQKYFSILETDQKMLEKAKNTLLLTVATLSEKTQDMSLKSSVLKYLVNQLLQCKSASTRQDYLRALKNTESPILIPILMKLIESQDIDSKSAVLAMDILSKFEGKILKQKIQNLDQHLLTLIHDPSKELGIKSAAFELTLTLYPMEKNVKEILNVLKNLQNNELKAVVLQKWMTLFENPTVRDLFK